MLFEIVAVLAVIYLIVRFSGSSKSKKYQRPLRPHEFHSSVAGVTYENPDGTSRQQIIKDSCHARQILQLKAEPENPSDHNAVKVQLSDGSQIGYLHAEVAGEISRYLLAGKRASATITEITGGRGKKKYFGVNIIVSKI